MCYDDDAVCPCGVAIASWQKWPTLRWDSHHVLAARHSHWKPHWSCGYLAKLAVKTQTGPLECVSPSSLSLPFPNTFNGLFTRWIHSIDPDEFRKHSI